MTQADGTHLVVVELYMVCNGGRCDGTSGLDDGGRDLVGAVALRQCRSSR